MNNTIPVVIFLRKLSNTRGMKQGFQPPTIDITGEIDTITEGLEQSAERKAKKKDLDRGDERGDNKSESYKDDRNGSVKDDDVATTGNGLDSRSIRCRLCSPFFSHQRLCCIFTL